MKVILREAVPKLGKAGDIKEVRMGYGFNFLLPRGLAELATLGNIKRVLALVQKAAKKREQELSKMAQAVAELAGKKVTIKMRSQEGKLFGSVTAVLIAEALQAKGHAVTEEAIELSQPIRKTGTHVVKAKAGDTEASFSVVVVTE